MNDRVSAIVLLPLLIVWGALSVAAKASLVEASPMMSALLYYSLVAVLLVALARMYDRLARTRLTDCRARLMFYLGRCGGLTDEQWAVISHLFPETPRREDVRCRSQEDTREVMDGILLILRSGARWEDLPSRFPPHQIYHRRFREWFADGTLRNVLEALAADHRERGGIDFAAHAACAAPGTTGKESRMRGGLSGKEALDIMPRRFEPVPLSSSARRLLRHTELSLVIGDRSET